MLKKLKENQSGSILIIVLIFIMFMFSYYTYTFYSVKFLKTQSLKNIQNIEASKFAENLYEEISENKNNFKNINTSFSLSNIDVKITNYTNVIKGYLDSNENITYKFDNYNSIFFLYNKNNSSLQKANENDVKIKTFEEEEEEGSPIQYEDLPINNCEDSRFGTCKSFYAKNLYLKTELTPLEYELRSTDSSLLKDNNIYVKVWSNGKLILDKKITI